MSEFMQRYFSVEDGFFVDHGKYINLWPDSSLRSSEVNDYEAECGFLLVNLKDILNEHYLKVRQDIISVFSQVVSAEQIGYFETRTQEFEILGCHKQLRTAITTKTRWQNKDVTIIYLNCIDVLDQDELKQTKLSFFDEMDLRELWGWFPWNKSERSRRRPLTIKDVSIASFQKWVANSNLLIQTYIAHELLHHLIEVVTGVELGFKSHAPIEENIEEFAKMIVHAPEKITHESTKSFLESVENNLKNNP